MQFKNFKDVGLFKKKSVGEPDLCSSPKIMMVQKIKDTFYGWTPPQKKKKKSWILTCSGWVSIELLFQD